MEAVKFWESPPAVIPWKTPKSRSIGHFLIPILQTRSTQQKGTALICHLFELQEVWQWRKAGRRWKPPSPSFQAVTATGAQLSRASC